MRLVPLTAIYRHGDECEEVPVWVNADAVCYLNVDGGDAQNTILHLGDRSLVVKGPPNKTVLTLG